MYDSKSDTPKQTFAIGPLAQRIVAAALDDAQRDARLAKDDFDAKDFADVQADLFSKGSE